MQTQNIPKVELHVHIEGTITPSLAKKLAARNGVKLNPSVLQYEDHYTFTDFLDFLNQYDMVADCIRTPQDYEDLVYDYLALESGHAAEKFAQMVVELGGPADLIEKKESHMPLAEVTRDVYLDDAGVITELNTREIGLSVVTLGGGRKSPTDDIDHAVGLSCIRGLGDNVDSNTPFCRIHARNEDQANAAEAAVKSAVTVGETSPAINNIVMERITS